MSLAGTFAAWSLTERIHVRKGSAIVLFLVHFVICAMDAVTLRFYQQAYPADLLHGALLKFAASLPCLTLALHQYLYERNQFGRMIVLAMVFAMAADIAFVKQQRPDRRALLLWIVLSLCAVGLLTLVRNKVSSTALFIMAACYLSILVSTCIFSYPLPKCIWTSAMVFALSDILLILNIVLDGSLFMRILALLVYYGSLILYGISLHTLNILPDSA